MCREGACSEREARIPRKGDVRLEGVWSYFAASFLDFEGRAAMRQALYRKYRPRTFDDVCGQEHITSVLRYEVANAAGRAVYR